MAGRATNSAKKALTRVTTAAKKAAKKVTKLVARAKSSKTAKRAEPARRTAQPRTTAKPRKATTNAATRKRKVEPDVPVEVLNRTYTPKQTSLKAGFRATGDERQRDQEMAAGFADEKWNDEDRFTNKSGDPRIGTHGRRYEPGE